MRYLVAPAAEVPAPNADEIALAEVKVNRPITTSGTYYSRRSLALSAGEA